ncbi:MAG: diacylglycerol kinase family lipid kinase [Bacteroidales bacterium]|jgi:diacylglycerol kinase family enzyme|nr:diacylglycerol kinase family lipid kinase [Bacteroidales bacterium]
MKKRIAYIINPRSGIGRESSITKIIKANTNAELIDLELIKLKPDVSARELARSLCNKADVVVAVGGDGTVNSVASALVGSNTALGIIPAGSGNGLARALDISLQPARAVEIINEMCVSKIDVLSFGDERYSFNVAGIGFDALIGHKFAKLRVRGPIQYMRLISTEFPLYKPKEYTLDMNSQLFVRKAFLISFANSSQWGYNIHIAPKAVMNDGLMDVCIINQFPNYAVPSMAMSLLSQNIDKNEYDEIIRTNQVKFDCGEGTMAHIDGEPIMLSGEVTINVLSEALSVVVPSSNFYESSRFSVAKLNNSINKKVLEITKARDEFRNDVLSQVDQIKATLTNASQNVSDELRKRFKKGRRN